MSLSFGRFVIGSITLLVKANRLYKIARNTYRKYIALFSSVMITLH